MPYSSESVMFFAPKSLKSQVIAVPAAPGPFTTIFTSFMSFFTIFKAFISPARTIIAVPC